jgi:MEDS: MEthanogen/methylotroph, DcmR Sensory domain
VIEQRVSDHVGEGGCPHLAVLLKTEDDLPRVLASFYALGAKRDAWLVHRALPGTAAEDRAKLAGEGLDVDALEASGQFVIAEMDPGLTPQEYGAKWTRALEGALAEGRTGMWYSRSAAGGLHGFETLLKFEQAWDEAFRDQPVVALCPFIVGELPTGEVGSRANDLAAMHDGVLAPVGEDYELLRRAG